MRAHTIVLIVAFVLGSLASLGCESQCALPQNFGALEAGTLVPCSGSSCGTCGADGCICAL